MRKLYVLPLLLLSGCALFSDDATDEMTYEYDAAEVVAEMPAPQPQTKPQEQPAVKPAVATISADGTVIELPAQQIYIGDNPMPAAPMAQRANVLSYSEPPEARPDLPPYQPQPAVVTLQNRAYPNTYAQCDAADMGCVLMYEQQGYVRVQGLPQFAGYQEILAPSDYPTGGRWRNGNNIPRW